MANWMDLSFDARLPETLNALNNPGCLLATRAADGKPNVMAIGWGSIGFIWGLPIFQVLVRPSRLTQTIIEETREFTVNVMPEDRADDVAYCGMVSGREIDKFTSASLTPTAGTMVSAPILDEALIAYECKVVLQSEVTAQKLDPALLAGSYEGGEFHRIYFGHVLAVRARA